MANDNKGGGVTAPPTKSRRDTALERLKARYPDKSFDDDESMYGQMLDDYDAGAQELNGYKERRKPSPTFSRATHAAQSSSPTGRTARTLLWHWLRCLVTTS